MKERKKMSNTVIFETVFGSYLYGTANAGSDFDVRGVYLSSTKDLVHGRALESRKDMSTDETIDSVHFSLSKFISMALKNDMISFDMLHAPSIPGSPNLRVNSEIWQQIINNRHRFYSKRALKNSCGMVHMAIKKPYPKVISHAYRWLYQCYCIADYGYYNFPLDSSLKKFIIDVNNEDITLSNDIMNELFGLLHETKEAIDKSVHIPEEPDYQYWDDFLEVVYSLPY